MCDIGAGTRGLEVAVTSVRNGNPRGTDNLRDPANEAPSRNHARGLGIRWRARHDSNVRPLAPQANANRARSRGSTPWSFPFSKPPQSGR